MKSVLLTAIVCTTAITLAAIFLNYAGAIDMRFGGEGIRITVESDEKYSPKTSDTFGGSL